MRLIDLRHTTATIDKLHNLMASNASDGVGVLVSAATPEKVLLALKRYPRESIVAVGIIGAPSFDLLFSLPLGLPILPDISYEHTEEQQAQLEHYRILSACYVSSGEVNCKSLTPLFNQAFISFPCPSFERFSEYYRESSKYRASHRALIFQSVLDLLDYEKRIWNIESIAKAESSPKDYLIFYVYLWLRSENYSQQVKRDLFKLVVTVFFNIKNLISISNSQVCFHLKEGDHPWYPSTLLALLNSVKLFSEKLHIARMEISHRYNTIFEGFPGFGYSRLSDHCFSAICEIISSSNIDDIRIVDKKRDDQMDTVEKSRLAMIEEISKAKQLPHFLFIALQSQKGIFGCLLLSILLQDHPKEIRFIVHDEYLSHHDLWAKPNGSSAVEVAETVQPPAKRARG